MSAPRLPAHSPVPPSHLVQASPLPPRVGGREPTRSPAPLGPATASITRVPAEHAHGLPKTWQRELCVSPLLREQACPRGEQGNRAGKRPALRVGWKLRGERPVCRIHRVPRSTGPMRAGCRARAASPPSDRSLALHTPAPKPPESCSHLSAVPAASPRPAWPRGCGAGGWAGSPGLGRVRQGPAGSGRVARVRQGRAGSVRVRQGRAGSAGSPRGSLVTPFARQVLHRYLGLHVFFPDPRGERDPRARPPDNVQPLLRGPGGSVRAAHTLEGRLLSPPAPRGPRALDTARTDSWSPSEHTCGLGVTSAPGSGQSRPTVTLQGHGRSPRHVSHGVCAFLVFPPASAVRDSGYVSLLPV